MQRRKEAWCKDHKPRPVCDSNLKLATRSLRLRAFTLKSVVDPPVRKNPLAELLRLPLSSRCGVVSPLPPRRRKPIVKKLSLILLSFIPAVPAGFLVYLMIRAMTLKHVWDKTALWVIICLTVVIAALVAIVPPLYAIAFYTGQSKSDEDVPGEEGGLAEAVEEAESDKGETAEVDAEAEEFPEEDLDAFEGEEVADAEEMADDFEPADTGSEFDLDDDGVAQSDTDDFDLGSADNFEEIEELEEEAPKPKKKKKK